MLDTAAASITILIHLLGMWATVSWKMDGKCQSHIGDRKIYLMITPFNYNFSGSKIVLKASYADTEAHLLFFFKRDKSQNKPGIEGLTRSQALEDYVHQVMNNDIVFKSSITFHLSVQFLFFFFLQAYDFASCNQNIVNVSQVFIILIQYYKKYKANLIASVVKLHRMRLLIFGLSMAPGIKLF